MKKKCTNKTRGKLSQQNGNVMDNLFKEIFLNKRILITGHTGFKGTWLGLWLTMLGAKVSGISLHPPSKPDLYSAILLKKKLYRHHIADVGNYEKLNRLISKEKPEIVFHFAAQPIVKISYDDPVHTYDTNIMGTVHLLEVMRTTDSVQVCIIATSDKCYHNDGNTYKPFGESDVLGGVDPYSASKACMELIVDSYRKSFYKENISVSTVRSGNVFGGGDWGNSRLFPDCIKAIERGDMIRIRKPDSVRPWIYMLDSLSGYLHLCSRMMENPRDFNSEWNIGPSEMDENYKTEFIVKRIIELYGKGKYEADGADFFEPAILKINSKKMSEKIGWSPLYDINTGIERTVDWYKMFYDKCDMAAYSMKEIDEYSDNTVMKRKTGSENPI